MESPAEIILFCPVINARLEYTMRFLSSTVGVKIRVGVKPTPTDDFKNAFASTEHCIINYSDKPMSGAFNIFSAGLLQESGITNQEPKVLKRQGLTLLFPAPEGFDLPFDLFSAVFYLLSRYEEYLPFESDRYGRFTADRSLAFRSGFLGEPAIDQWCVILKNALLLRYTGLKIPERKFTYVSTIDIDNPWAFKNKGFMRSVGGLLKSALSFNPEDLKTRLSVLLEKQKDPFDTFGSFRETEEKHNFRSVYFFLFANYGKPDNNHALNSPRFHRLVSETGHAHETGIHPSFRSNYDPRFFAQEYDMFSNILGRKPTISRQHFLILQFPDTYRKLTELGIQADYSMGFADQPGFRAGTCTPFRYYDLINETETDLVVHPFSVMDVTLRQYLHLTPDEALERIGMLVDKVKAVNGTFTSLWHNESLSEYGVWKGWRMVFEGMVKRVTSYE